jgi:hypothetical protein
MGRTEHCSPFGRVLRTLFLGILLLLTVAATRSDAPSDQKATDSILVLAVATKETEGTN